MANGLEHALDLVFPALVDDDLYPAGAEAASLRGRGAGDPLLRTTGNFVRAVPLALLVSAIAWTWRVAEWRGILLAVLSGAGASALGYVAWYAALPRLSATRASA